MRLCKVSTYPYMRTYSYYEYYNSLSFSSLNTTTTITGIPIPHRQTKPPTGLVVAPTPPPFGLFIKSLLSWISCSRLHPPCFGGQFDWPPACLRSCTCIRRSPELEGVQNAANARALQPFPSSGLFWLACPTQRGTTALHNHQLHHHLYHPTNHTPTSANPPSPQHPPTRPTSAKEENRVCHGLVAAAGGAAEAFRLVRVPIQCNPWQANPIAGKDGACRVSSPAPTVKTVAAMCLCGHYRRWMDSYTE